MTVDSESVLAFPTTLALRTLRNSSVETAFAENGATKNTSKSAHERARLSNFRESERNSAQKKIHASGREDLRVMRTFPRKTANP
jgi:hypothetical protein